MVLLRVALGQMSSLPANPDANLKIIEGMCERAQEDNVDLIIFPELSVTGYLMHDEVFNLAEKIPEGNLTQKLRKIANRTNVSILAGLPEKERPGVLYNSAVFVQPNSETYTTRKILLPNHSVFNEKRYFKPAEEIKTTPSPWGGLGVQICYDLFSPEISRFHALNGSPLLICLSASPGVRQQLFESFIKARAAENASFLIYVNQAGVQDDLIFWGGSEVCDPSGKQLLKLKYDEPDYGVVEIDLSQVDRTRTFIPTIRDAPGWIYTDLKEAQARR
ncbi:MAG: carbon-nitrogen hydrolase family protein [Candidatus Heimdallarchaeota archaeon]|nr:carbon-nitrogen hydrolase family protein [Candidatus Heimdallarchaeota archaeon]MCK5048524.1 carbon-nitrogen hydrolase family protein [Candidatus Heimdallarchaeota archaeon]